jgi:hypothetical protein
MCGLIAMMFYLVLGKVVDDMNVKILTPLAFMARALSLFGILFIRNPSATSSFACLACITISGILVNLSVDSYFSKIVP